MKKGGSREFSSRESSIQPIEYAASGPLSGPKLPSKILPGKVEVLSNEDLDEPPPAYRDLGNDTYYFDDNMPRAQLPSLDDADTKFVPKRGTMEPMKLTSKSNATQTPLSRGTLAPFCFPRGTCPPLARSSSITSSSGSSCGSIMSDSQERSYSLDERRLARPRDRQQSLHDPHEHTHSAPPPPPPHDAPLLRIPSPYGMQSPEYMRPPSTDASRGSPAANYMRLPAKPPEIPVTYTTAKSPETPVTYTARDPSSGLEPFPAQFAEQQFAGRQPEQPFAGKQFAEQFAGRQPVEQFTGQQPVEQFAGQQPAEQQFTEQPADQQPADQQPADQQPAEQQPADQQPADQQPEYQLSEQPVWQASARSHARDRRTRTAPSKSTEVKTHQCGYPGCNWSFARSSDHKRHLRSHEKPSLWCPYSQLGLGCTRRAGSFYRLDVLKRHLRLVHLCRPVNGASEGGDCRVCLKYFSSTRTFIEHCEQCAKEKAEKR